MLLQSTGSWWKCHCPDSLTVIKKLDFLSQSDPNLVSTCIFNLCKFRLRFSCHMPVSSVTNARQPYRLASLGDPGTLRKHQTYQHSTGCALLWIPTWFEPPPMEAPYGFQGKESTGSGTSLRPHTRKCIWMLYFLALSFSTIQSLYCCGIPV